MSKELTLAYLPSAELQMYYSDFKRSYYKIPLQWRDEQLFLVPFFFYQKVSAPENLIKLLNEAIEPFVGKAIIQLNYNCLNCSSKTLSAQAIVPLQLKELLKECAKVFKHSILYSPSHSCSEMKLSLQLAKFKSSNLELKHLESLRQSIFWKDKVDSLVLVEKTKKGLYILHEFALDVFTKQKAKPLFPSKAFLRAKS
ncbi:MAG: hypothetical protein L7U87_02735 [Chlamydiales bacterium]|nr:hypothetical protein [Chlamydiales bacterium]